MPFQALVRVTNVRSLEALKPRSTNHFSYTAESPNAREYIAGEVHRDETIQQPRSILL